MISQRVDIQNLVKEMTQWRHWLHQHAETAFEEHETAAFVAKKLRLFGVEVHEGIAGTGVVGVISSESGVGSSEHGAIGLRAEMDGLHLEEKTGLPYASKNVGAMHACGHDGHMAMLLGAAKVLAERRDFAGTVYVIFQPAEENEGGAKRMIEEGILKKFPMKAIFAMHNQAGLPVGSLGFRQGPIMAAYDVFDITITGKGCHAAHPEEGVSPFSAVGAMVEAIQSQNKSSRDLRKKVVASVTQIQGGSTWNVIPDQVRLRGTCRTFDKKVQDKLELALKKEAKRIGKKYSVNVSAAYTRRYPATINSARETTFAAEVGEAVVGAKKVIVPVDPSMGAEDFAFFLQKVPGSYLRIGAGKSASLHSSSYDFNDKLLPVGVAYWVELVKRYFGNE
ncbi:MAG: M20 aminoacylase family protein [bacterium]|nr:M20 aminoacylase family protein [bacterium]